MFEDSLVDSGKGLQAAHRRWMIAASLGVQAAVVAGFLAVPLMWPAVLPVVVAAPRISMTTLVTLPKPKPKLDPVPRVATRVTATTASRAPAKHEAATVATLRGGGVIARGSLPAGDAGDAPSLPAGSGMDSGMGSGMGSIFAGGPGFGTVGSPSVRLTEAVPPRPAGPVKVSSGVSAGLLLEAIKPVYPAIARAARVEGTVVLTAVIGKDGRIRGLQVVSGPEMLRRAALDAVQVARYTPYQLNGQPTDVVTTVSVVFRMQG